MAKTVSIYFGDSKRMPFELEASAIESLTFNEAVFGHLIDVTSDHSLRPALLERFYFDKDLGGFVLSLRSGVQFTNGRIATSKDLEFSLLRGFFSAKKNYFGVYFGNIEGTESISPGSPFKSGSVKGVRVIDERKLLVKLKAPNPSFLHSLGNLVVRLVPMEELESDLFTWKSKPVGAGAYAIKHLDKANFIVELEPRDLKKSKNTFRLIFAKSATTPDISFVSNPEFTSVRNKRPVSVMAVFFSNKDKLAKLKSFRKSLANAIDKKTIISDTQQLADELLPSSFWGRSDGSKNDDTVSKFKGDTVQGRILNLGPKPPEAKLRLQSAIESAIRKMSATPNVTFTSAKFLNGPGDETSSVFGVSILANYYDPLIMFNVFGPESPVPVISLKSDKQFMKLYSDAEVAKDFSARLESVRALSEYVLKEHLVVPIAYELSELFFNPKTVSSIGQIDEPNLIHLDRVILK